MDDQVFSLEDDDYGDLFITQTPSQVNNFNIDLDKSEDELLCIGDNETKLESKGVSIVKPLQDPQYSDISDTEDVQCDKNDIPIFE